MNKEEQIKAAPKYKTEGTLKFKNGDFVGAGEKYESALKCIGKIFLLIFFEKNKNKHTKSPKNLQ